VNRTAALAVLGALLLAGCKEPKQGPASTIQGSTNVELHTVKFFTAASGNTSSGLRESYYVVCALTFTNTYGFDVAPEPKNFVLTDPIGNQYIGVDTGSSQLVGISNYRGLVKKDEKQDYTIAFHVPANVAGAIFYSP
jgi:hypothetical protein